MHLEETEINGVKVLSQILRLFRIIKLCHALRGLVIVMIEQCNTNWSSVYFCSNITKAGRTPMIEQMQRQMPPENYKALSFTTRPCDWTPMIEQCSTNWFSVYFCSNIANAYDRAILTMF